MRNAKRLPRLFSWVPLLLGWRRCQHCGNSYPRREMVKIRETGWYHHDHPMPQEEEEPSLLETLRRSRAILKTCLDTAAKLDAVPTKNQINALVQSINVFNHLELQPASDDYLTLFLWQNLPGYLEQLHVEAQVLRQECRKGNAPTRSLLEQQVLLKQKGESFSAIWISCWCRCKGSATAAALVRKAVQIILIGQTIRRSAGCILKRRA